MSKASTVTAPFVLLLMDVWPLQRVQWNTWRQATFGVRRVVLEKAPFFVFTVAVSLVTLLAQRSDSMASLAAYPLWLRGFYSVLAYGNYLLKTVWPVDLAIVYPLPRELPWLGFALSALALLGLSWWCWWWRRTRPHLLIGWLWFVGTLVPVIGLVQVGCQSMADRYTYLPHLGLFLGLAFEGQYWIKHWRADDPKKAAMAFEARPSRRRRQLAAGILAAVALLACLTLTEHQVGYWVDGRTLFTHTLAATRDNAFAHLNLGVSLEHAGERDSARREYEEALRLDPGLPEAHANLGDLLNELGQTDAALAQYRESLRLQGQSRVHENLGALLAKLGQVEPAMAHYAAAAKLDPEDSRPYYLMGKALLRQGQSSQAVGQFQEALRRDGNDLQTLVFLARVLAAAQDPRVRNGAQAVAFAESANTLSGGAQSFVLDTLAMSYAEGGRFAEAVKTQQDALARANEAGEKDAVQALEERLELYRNGKAYRESFTSPKAKGD
jgi:tetratricopeptide (TPR) repeat protein